MDNLTVSQLSWLPHPNLNLPDLLCITDTYELFPTSTVDKHPSTVVTGTMQIHTDGKLKDFIKAICLTNGWLFKWGALSSEIKEEKIVEANLCKGITGPPGTWIQEMQKFYICSFFSPCIIILGI